MDLTNLVLLGSGGLSGFLSACIGAGGGFALVPILLAFAGATNIQAAGTSSIIILFSKFFAGVHNWRKGYLDLRKVLVIGIPATIFAQMGVWLVPMLPDFVPLIILGTVLIANIFAVRGRKQERFHQKVASKFLPLTAISIGSLIGLLAGLTGIGGGVAAVPLQLRLLGEDLKTAIRVSLAVVVLSSASASSRHLFKGSILWESAIWLLIGDIIGTQIGMRFVDRVHEKPLIKIYQGFCAVGCIYVLFKAFYPAVKWAAALLA